MKRFLFFIVVFLFFTIYNKYTSYTTKNDSSVSWYSKNSLYSQIKSHINPQIGTLERNFKISDTTKFYFSDTTEAEAGVNKVKYFMDEKEIDVYSTHVAEFAYKVSKYGKKDDKEAFYEFIKTHNTFSYIDSSLSKFFEKGVILQPYFIPMIDSIVENAPDREAVKFAIATYACCSRDDEKYEILKTLAQCPDFTLYSAFTASRWYKNKPGVLLDLAKDIHHSGRESVIEQMNYTEDAFTRQWLLTDSYKENGNYLFSPLICLEKGDLYSYLKSENSPDWVLGSAGDILNYLMDDDYYDIENIHSLLDAYINLVELKKPDKISHYNAMHLICRNFSDTSEYEFSDTSEASVKEFEEIRRNQSSLCQKAKKILAWPTWQTRITESLKASDQFVLKQALQAASYTGIDSWDVAWALLMKEPDNYMNWSYLTSGILNSERVNQLIEFAEKMVETDTDNSKYSHAFHALDVLYEYEGFGKNLIIAGLKKNSYFLIIQIIDILKQWKNIDPELVAVMKSSAEIIEDEEAKTAIYEFLNSKKL